MKKEKGFTLLEISIVLGVILILIAILVPSIEKNISDAKVARALSDSREIAKAMIEARKDLGKWPIEDSTISHDPCRVLIGSKPSVSGAYIPPPSSSCGTPCDWKKDPAETIYYELVNPSNHYPKLNPNPHNYPSWNGPYINDTKLDPWGKAYLINSAYLDNGPDADPTRRIFVISGGPNNLMDTYFDGTNEIKGDDVGFRIR